jgi:hypothetical protein
MVVVCMVSNELYKSFSSYNTTWIPLLSIFWILLVFSTILVLVRPNRHTNTFVKIILAGCFLWNGIVFFPFYMTTVALPGAVFSIGAGIFFALDIFRDKIAVCLPKPGWLRYVTLILVVWALGVYSLAGILSGHPYPQGPLAVAPCPVTILTLALVSTSMDTLQKDRWPFTLLFMLLLFWGIFAGLGAPFLYGFYVDLTLLIAGVYGLFMLVCHWKAAPPAR